MRDIPYGTANFETIRTENLIYVDKTMYIEKLEQTPARQKCIYLRPRRFGKSLFTSMLTNYYSIDTINKFEKLFKGLYIYDNPTKNKNNYYVLNFDFSGLAITGRNVVEEGAKAFYSAVNDSIFSFLSKYNLHITPQGDTASDLLRNLLVKIEALKLEHKVYIIIDEYDNFTNAILKGDGKDFLDLVGQNGYVRAFYEVIKSKIQEGVVERFFATGVMPVTLDNLTSGFNIATNLTTQEDFVSMIGFTHEEVKELVKEVIPKQDVERVYEDLKANYDGYRFSTESDERTFNSTLVMYYLSNYLPKGKPPKNLLDANMATSGEKIRKTVELVKPKENYKTIEEIIYNNEVYGNIKNEILLDNSFGKDSLLTILFHLGYLTISDVQMVTKFKVPNYVTEVMYSQYLTELLAMRKEYSIQTDRISSALVEFGQNGNIYPMTELVKDFLVHCSNRDTEKFNEKNLKYVFTIFLSLSNQFYVYGEFPANQGFVDIFVGKTSASMATYEAIIELKYMSKEKGKHANKQKLIQEAKVQLAKYMEDNRLQQKENLKKYVIIFTGFEDVAVEEIGL